MKASNFASAKQSLNYGHLYCPAPKEVVFVATSLDAAPIRLDKSYQSKFSKTRRFLEAHFFKVEAKSSFFRAILLKSRKATLRSSATKRRANT
jgi:hypothetical protein